MRRGRPVRTVAAPTGSVRISIIVVVHGVLGFVMGGAVAAIVTLNNVHLDDRLDCARSDLSSRHLWLLAVEREIGMIPSDRSAKERFAVL